MILYFPHTAKFPNCSGLKKDKQDVHLKKKGTYVSWGIRFSSHFHVETRVDLKHTVGFLEVSTTPECLVPSQFELFVLPCSILEEFLIPKTSTKAKTLCWKEMNTSHLFTHILQKWSEKLYSRICNCALMRLFCCVLCIWIGVPSSQVSSFVHFMVNVVISICEEGQCDLSARGPLEWRKPLANQS